MATPKEPINFAAAASLFQGVTQAPINDLLEGIEKCTEATSRVMVMLSDKQGDLTTVPVSSLTLPALKLLVSAGRPFFTSELASLVVGDLVAMWEKAETICSAEEFGAIVSSYTTGEKDFKSPAFAIQNEIPALHDQMTPRPLCWVVAVSPYLTSTATGGALRSDSDYLELAGNLRSLITSLRWWHSLLG